MIKVFILIICAVALYSNYRSNKLFSSSSIWLAIYSLIFVLYPLLSEKNFRHEDSIDVYALIGVISFCCGSFFSSILRSETKINILSWNSKYPSYNIALKLYIFSLVCFIISSIVAIGQSGIFAILNGNMTSKQVLLDESMNISTLYLYFLHIMFPCVVIVWISQNGKIQKINSFICLAIYFALTVIFAFTRLFLICLLGILLFFQMRYKEKKIQLLSIIIGVVVLVTIMVSMNYIRCLGLGQMSSMYDVLNIDYVLESTDFGASYYFFDRLLDFDSPHINPFVWLKALYSFVPRSVWLAKPEPLSMQVLKYTDPGLAATGFSTAGNSVLGEAFAIMGEVGFAIFPFVWGVVCTRLDNNYQHRLLFDKNRSMADILYYFFCFFIIVSAQRGDWSQYTVMLFWFYFLPIYFTTLFSKK